MMTSEAPYVADPGLSKLVRMYGPQKADLLVKETLRELGLAALETPDDRMRFGGALLKKGGLLEAIGRAIRIQAILHGARED